MAGPRGPFPKIVGCTDAACPHAPWCWRLKAPERCVWIRGQVARPPGRAHCPGYIPLAAGEAMEEGL